MLNKNNERELAYVVIIEEIKPIEGYDRVEYARIGAGWWVVVKKNQFKVGDFGIYFEIDSKVPEREPFMFLEKKHFKVKTQKMCKVVSQGLLMAAEDFGEGWHKENSRIVSPIGFHYADDESRFLTKELGVTYAEIEDNKRKASSGDKYKKMAQRNSKIAKTFWWRWLYKREWGKKFLFFFFGKKKDKKSGWPYWVVKTDEERAQNCSWLFPGNNEEWVATEKVDGTSTTFTMKGFGRKREFYVCSRNVVFDKPDKKCFYDTNVYTEMAVKYDMENKMSKMLEAKHKEDNNIEFITIQGETYGVSVQKRDYGMKEHDLRVFNVIFGYKDGHTVRLNPIDGQKIMSEYDIPYVPIIDEHFKIPATCKELLEIATGKSMIDGGMREGLVFRTYDGIRSFKAVSNEFLLKYHQ